MKKILLLLLPLFCNSFLFAQPTSSDCLQFHTGKFSYFDSSNNTIFVTRKKNRQEEYNHQTKVKTVLKIKWISDCSYQITQTWSNSKQQRKSSGTYTIVNITKIIGNGDGYEYSCTCEDPNIKLRNSGIMRKENN
jgi:hypothetical protein